MAKRESENKVSTDFFRRLGSRNPSDLVEKRDLITAELQTRAGLSYSDFVAVHNPQTGCNVSSKFIRSTPSGFYIPSLDCEASAAVNVLRCETHQIESAEFWDHVG